MTIVPLQPDAAALVNLDDLDNMFAAVEAESEAEVVTARPPASNNATSLTSSGSGGGDSGDTGDTGNNGSSGTASATPPPANRFGREPAASGVAVTPNAAPKKARKPWAPPVQDSGASPFSVVKFKRSPPRDQVPAGPSADVPCSFLGSCRCKNCL